MNVIMNVTGRRDTKHDDYVEKNFEFLVVHQVHQVQVNNGTA